MRVFCVRAFEWWWDLDAGVRTSIELRTLLDASAHASKVKSLLCDVVFMYRVVAA